MDIQRFSCFPHYGERKEEFGLVVQIGLKLQATGRSLQNSFVSNEGSFSFEP